MRIKASLGVLAGLACLTASAVVRRNDGDTTCTTTTTDRSPLVVTVPQFGSSATSDGVLTVTVPAGTPGGMTGTSVPSSAISASVLTFTLPAGSPGMTASSVASSVHTPSVITVTVPAGDAGNTGYPSISSDASVPVFTVTIPGANPGDSGSSAISDANGFDTTCTTSDNVFTIGQSTSAAQGPITVTVTKMPSGPAGPTGISTVTVPVVTVTLPGPPPPGWPFGSSSTATVPAFPGATSPVGPLVTLTIPVGNGGSGSDITVTVPLASVLPSSTPAVTAPQPTGPAGSVVTVTIPEGSGHTATIVLTITVPDGGLDNWSTIITAPGAAGTPTGAVVTVTALTTPATDATAFPVPSNGASGSGIDTTCASLTLGLSSSGATSWLPITLPPPQTTGVTGLPNGPESAMTITYTLPEESGMTAPFTGVMTITLSPPVSAPVSNGPFGSWPAGSPMPTFGHHSSPSVGPAVPPTLGTTCASADVITYTVPAMGTHPAYTGTLTISSGGPFTETGTSPAILTLTSTVSAGSQGSPNGPSAGPSFTTVFPGPITTTLLGETLTFAGSTLGTGPSPYISQSGGNDQPTQPSNGGAGSSSNSESNVFTVTLPGGQGISSGASVAAPTKETLTLSVSPSVSGLPGLFTVTIPEGSGSPGSPNGGSTGINTGSQSTVFTVTQSVTPHATSSSPAATGSVIAVTYTVPAGPGGTESVYTVTYTVPPWTSDSGSFPSEIPGYGGSGESSVTIKQSGSSVATPSSASGPAVVTITNGSGSLTVLTLTPKQSLTSTKTAGSGNSPVTATITENSGSPATITSVVSSPSQPGSGATPVTYTFTDASGSPHVITLTPTGANQPSTVTSVVSSALAPGSGTIPLTVTITDASGMPHTVTLTLSGEGSVPTATSEVPGYGSEGANGGAIPSIITVTPLTGTPFVATITLSGGAVPTSTPESSNHVSTVTIEEFSTVTFGTASLLTATLSGSPIVFTTPVSSGPASLTGTPSSESGHPMTLTIPLSGSSTAPAGYGGASVPGSGSGGSSGSLVTVTLDSGSTVVLTIPIGGHSATSSGVGASTITKTVESSPTSVSILVLTPTVMTYTMPGAYGQDGTVFTVSTDVPVSSQSSSGSIEVLTFTLPTSSATAAAPSFITSSSTCTTFTTVVRSTTKSGSSDPDASGQVSVVTVTLGSGSNTVLTIPLAQATAAQGSSTTCTETSTQTSSKIRTATVIQVSSIIGTLFPDQTIPSSVPLDSSVASSDASDLLPPPQTEFLGAESTQDVPGYSFATAQPDAYGNSVSAYGSSPASTSADEPVQGSETSASVTPTITVATLGSASASADDQPTPATGTSTDSSSLVSTSATDAISATTAALNATSSASSAPLNVTSLGTGWPSVTVASTATAGAVLPSASCDTTGDRGQTMLTFDDIVPSNATGSVSLDIPSTYHRFQFSDGFSVVSSSASRYVASSGNQMVEYNTSAGPVARVSLSDDESNGCFRFDFLGISLGCNSTGTNCEFAITGVQWNGTAEITQASKSIQVAGCTESSNCTMLHQMLDSAAASQFTNLTALNISLTVDGQPQVWWADDLSVAWTDNTCEAASCRAVVPPVDIMVLNPRRRFSKRIFGWMA